MLRKTEHQGRGYKGEKRIRAGLQEDREKAGDHLQAQSKDNAGASLEEAALGRRSAQEAVEESGRLFAGLLLDRRQVDRDHRVDVGALFGEPTQT